GSLLYLGDAAGDAHHDVGPQETRWTGQHLTDERFEHLLGEGVIGDHAVGHGPHSGDVARGPAEHPVRFLANGLDVGRALHHGDHGRLAQQHALTLHMDPNVRGAEVYADHAHTLPRTKLR